MLDDDQKEWRCDGRYNIAGSQPVPFIAMLNFVPTPASIPPKDVYLRLKELTSLPINIQPLVS